MVLPRPHVIVVQGERMHDVTILCRVQGDRHDLVAALIDASYPPASYPPLGVEVIFDVVLPQHNCRGTALCYAIIHGERKMFYHDVHLVDGTFVQIYSWEAGEDQSTSCGSPAHSLYTDWSQDDFVYDPLEHEAFDDVVLTQSQQRLVPDDGCTQQSQERLLRCSEMGLSWIVPERLHQERMYNLCKYAGRDSVREYFIRQRFIGSDLSIQGWLFHDHQQLVGQSFAWGLNSRSPWAQQTGHLLRGTALDDVLLYTVVPQPEDFHLTLPNPTSMQVLIPSIIVDHPFQILVQEHEFGGGLDRQAVRLPVPFTVLNAFKATFRMAVQR